MNELSFKTFESVKLKSTSNIEIGNKIFLPGETLAYFDNIQIAGLDEVRSLVTAKGGFDNRPHVFWETTKDIQIQFSQGVFSYSQLALLSNSKLGLIAPQESIMVAMREDTESNEEGKITCKYTPAQNIFVYKKSTGEKLTFTQSGNILTISELGINVIVDYDFSYTSGGQVMHIGQKLLSGYVSLEGRTRLKDDTTGQVVTGLIKIPRLKLMSNLSLRLGKQASPVVANFSGVGVPTGSRGNAYVCEFYYLSDDIESDL